MPDVSLTLHELNAMVREVLDLSLPEAYWIVAELSEVRPASNGHCYLEFVEKNERTNALVAKARGVIWRDVYILLGPYFEQTTGQRLAPGMKVLVQVSVAFHELYGYTLNVTDIDPSYTLGDVARRRQEIIERLTADGVITLNKELTLPRPLLRIAVISSATAAGYGDFCNQLEQSGIPFVTRLFPAVMQGDRVEASVISALDTVAEEMEQWDAVVIIRGGGAVSDLNGFDTYLLAASVAQFPLPVLSGIGHERDDTVVDLVAHTRLKTPTAVAAFLVERQRGEEALVANRRTRLAAAVRTEMERARRRIERASMSLRLTAGRFGSRERQRLSAIRSRLQMGVERGLAARSSEAERLHLRLRSAVDRDVMRRRHRLELLRSAVEAASPHRILRLGYSMTLCDGRVVRDASALQPGARLTTVFDKGTAVSVVEEIKNEKDKPNTPSQND